MIVKRLNNEMLDDARKSAIQNFNSITYVTPPSNNSRALLSIASSNLAIMEILSRGLEESYASESRQHQCQCHCQESRDQMQQPGPAPVPTIGKSVFIPADLSRTIIAALDMAEIIIKNENKQNLTANCEAFGTASQQIRNTLANFARADLGEFLPTEKDKAHYAGYSDGMTAGWNKALANLHDWLQNTPGVVLPIESVLQRIENMTKQGRD